MMVLTKHIVLTQIPVSLIFLISVSVSFGENVKSVELGTDVAPVIRISQGELKGLINISRDGRKYSSFLGIQFGKSKRFQESELADAWNGTFNATTFGSSCLQFDESQNSIVGSENCLFLNVYTPKLTDNNDNMASLPVMVYFHGGGFLFGSGADYGAKYFMDEDVVLVTVNYRLGPFGFVDTDIGTNIGIKDQTLSLEWVKLNIHHFGGDAETVTIFGESAGGKSVGLHILSPMSRGLFHRAISQSGVALSKNILLEDPIREFRKLGVLMDCPTSNRKYLTECLSKVDGKYMLNRIEEASTLPGYSVDDIPNFGVTVESSRTGNARVFLPDTPINLLLKGQLEHIPYILGGNSDEALYIFINLATSQAERDRVNEWWSEYAPQTFMYEKDNCKTTNEIREFYLRGHQIGSIDTIQNISNAITDRLILHPTKISAEFHSKFARTYLYYFSLRGPGTSTMDPRWSSLNLSSDGLAPAGHTDELQYLFTTKSLDKEILRGSPFEKFSDWFVNLWVTFAKKGITPNDWNPLHRHSTDGSEIETATQGSKTRKNITQWYQIDTHSRMRTEPDLLGERMNFWNNVFPFKSI